jgi:hypothetical protein
MYCSAISGIYVLHADIPPHLLPPPRPPLILPDGEEVEPCVEYSVDAFEYIVSSVRSKCPRIRWIDYEGPDVPPGEWRVVFACNHVGDQTTGNSLGSGVVSYAGQSNLDLASPPPLFHIAPSLPKGYTIRQSVQLLLYPGTDNHVNKQYFPAWLNSLRTNICHQDIGRSIDFGCLPVTLDDVIHLYNLQGDHGPDERLAYIAASYAVNWDIHDFTRLSLVTS